MLELAARLGILGELNAIINRFSGLGTVEDKKLERDKLYTVEEICKRQAGAVATTAQGRDYDDALFRRSCAVDLYAKTPAEAYPGTVLDARIPIYFEHFIKAGEQVAAVTRELGMDWWDISFYKALPDWHPCPAYAAPAPGYDLFLANSKVPLLGSTVNSENPWIADICSRNRLDYRVLLHTSAAKERGILDGDMVCLESPTGKVQGRVRVTEGVHPEVIGTLGNLGHWARGKPIARGKGIHSNSLVAFSWDMVDPISGQIDTCARVKVYKVEG